MDQYIHTLRLFAIMSAAVSAQALGSLLPAHWASGIGTIIGLGLTSQFDHVSKHFRTGLEETLRGGEEGTKLLQRAAVALALGVGLAAIFGASYGPAVGAVVGVLLVFVLTVLVM